MNINKIALIGYGEVGQVLAADLAVRTQAAIAAFDIKFDDGHSSPSKAIANSAARKTASTSACVIDADIAISAVTAASTVAAAQAASAALKKGAWYFDLNSASPAAKAKASAAIEQAGGRYIEASVMSPIEPKRLAAPILLGGRHAREFESVAADFGFSDAKFYSAIQGKTAAAKLCRSVVIKGMEALISESLLAARHYGVEDDVIASLENLFPHPNWREHARYMISRTLQHGTRRAEEMQEAARTVADAGIDPWMANATVMRQAYAASLDMDGAVDELDQLLAVIHTQAAKKNKKLEMTR
ncbi:DUF1932 domain-containing protein [Hyphococcus sp.]|uniref:DUF1932 domain-containing protein n=1 Tax=Hyphococcus sp. TaxID=2038636 RepID=UPI003CCBF5A1